MTRADATLAARRESARVNLALVVVREGPHADEFCERDADGQSYGYCPIAAKGILYPHGEIVETVGS